MRSDNNFDKEVEKKLVKLTKEDSGGKVKRNNRKRSNSMPTVVQKLFRTCRDVFANCEGGRVPPNADVERLRLVLDGMKPADVGLTQEMPYFRMIKTEGSPPITYLHLYACNKFSIGIFCLPANGVIPLHNHPGMTVFSKLLFGSMHIKSYDWANLPQNASESLNSSYFKPHGVQLAKVKVDSVLTAPCNTSILYPADGGNMHCFTALTSCAVLDVLGPPYSDPEGRHCTYYLDFPYTSFSDDAGAVEENERESYAWLEEREKPDDLNVVGAMYRGPKIVK